MGRALWTYERRPAGAHSAGLEDYVVEARWGERAGTVTTVLEREGERFLVVERGTPPLSHDLRAIPWDEISSVDHSALTVRLRMPLDAIEAGLELDPADAVEGGERAEATRAAELPRELRPDSSPDAGPVDRPSYLLAFGLATLGLLALLALFVAATRVDFTWHFALFAVPGALLALAGVAGYRWLRRPSERLE